MNPSGSNKKEAENKDQPKQEKVNVAKGMATRERSYAIICAKDMSQTTAEGQNKQMCDKLVEIHNELKESTDKLAKRLLAVGASSGMWQQFFYQQDQLNGQLPVIPDLDLTQPSEAEKLVTAEVDKVVLSWDNYVKEHRLEELENTKKEELRKDYEETRSKIIQGYMSRYAIGMTLANPVINDVALRDHVYKRLASEDMLLAADEKGRVNEEYMQKLREKSKNVQLDSKEQRDEFKQWLEQTTIKVSGTEGLYYKLDLEGEKVFFLEDLSKQNIDIVVANKAHRDVITWNNIPKNKQKIVENSCLIQWKRVVINGKETKLSKTRPEEPRKWAQWLKNIYQEHKKSGPNLCKQLVQYSTSDPKLQEEFWEDVSLHCDDEKILSRVLDSYSEEQRSFLQEKMTEQIQNAQKQIDAKEEGLDANDLTDVRIKKEASKLKKDMNEQKLAKLAGKKEKGMSLFWDNLPSGIAEGVCKKLDDQQKEVLLKVATKKLNKAVAKLYNAEAEVKKAQKEVAKIKNSKNQAGLQKAKDKLQIKEAELQAAKDSCAEEKKKCDAFFPEYKNELNIAKKLDDKTKKYLYQSDKAENLQKLTEVVEGQSEFIEQTKNSVESIDNFKPENSSQDLDQYFILQQQLLAKRIELIQKEQNWVKDQKIAIEGGELDEHAEDTIAKKVAPLKKEIEGLEKEIQGLNKKIKDKGVDSENQVVDKVEAEVKNNQQAMDKLVAEQNKTKEVLADFAIAQRRFGVFSDSSSVALADKSKTTKSIVNPKYRESTVSEDRDTEYDKIEEENLRPKI